MRSPAGTGVCCPIISFTLVTALAVNETGGVFFTSGSATLVFTSGTVVVAIRISLALKYLNYNRAGQGRQMQVESSRPHFVLLYIPALRSTIPLCELANGSIMSALGRPRRSGHLVSASSGIRGLPNPILARWPMTWTWTPLMLGLAIVWGVFTVGLIILLIYRSTLTMHEDEQLYLDDANSHMQQEQTELLVKVDRLTVPVWVFGAGSGVLLLVLAGMFIYQGVNAAQ